MRMLTGKSSVSELANEKGSMVERTSGDSLVDLGDGESRRESLIDGETWL